MFENVSDYLHSGIKEKATGFAILFVAVYSVIWNFSEPIISNYYIRKHEIVDIWWFCQLILTLITSFIIFFLLVPTKILQKFGFDSGDSQLIGFARIPNETPNPPKVIFDGYLGKVGEFDMTFDYHIDWDVKPIAQRAKRLMFICSPERDFTFYVRLKIMSHDESIVKDIWIAMKDSIHKPDGNDHEWGHPLMLNPYRDKWFRSNFSFEKLVMRTCGKSGWKYSRIEGFRIRGKCLLHSVVLT